MMGSHPRHKAALELAAKKAGLSAGERETLAAVYQVVEAVQQLRGEAGQSQVSGARTVMAQSVGGSGSVAVTHILQA